MEYRETILWGMGWSNNACYQNMEMMSSVCLRRYRTCHSLGNRSSSLESATHTQQIPQRTLDKGDKNLSMHGFHIQEQTPYSTEKVVYGDAHFRWYGAPWRSVSLWEGWENRKWVPREPWHTLLWWMELSSNSLFQRGDQVEILACYDTEGIRSLPHRNKSLGNTTFGKQQSPQGRKLGAWRSAPFSVRSRPDLSCCEKSLRRVQCIGNGFPPEDMQVFQWADGFLSILPRLDLWDKCTEKGTLN